MPRSRASKPGVIHSPAIGFFMDVVPVIRCVYRAKETRLGTKPVLYLDRHGERVSLPAASNPRRPSKRAGRGSARQFSDTRSPQRAS